MKPASATGRAQGAGPASAQRPRPPRLLHVTTVEVTLRSFLAAVARHFGAQGWHVDALAAGAEGESEALQRSYDDLWGLPLSRNPLDPRNPTAGLAALRRRLQEGRYDVVHVMTPVAGFLTRLAARTLPVARRPRVVYVAHGLHFYQGGARVPNGVYRALESVAAPWTDYFGVVNAEDGQAVLKAGWVPSDRLFVQPGVGVDLDRFRAGAFAEEAARVREGLSLPPQTPLLVSVAEFTARKRQADLIQAFARSEVPGAHLLLAGTGPLLDSCRALAEALGVAGRVHFLGFRRDVPALMAAANAVVLVSEQEGLPTCVIEALGVGTAVVGTDIRGTRDLLAGTGNRLVPLGDIWALGRALREASAEAPAFVRPREYPGVERYGLENVLRVHEAVYAAALRAGPVPEALRFPVGESSPFAAGPANA